MTRDNFATFFFIFFLSSLIAPRNINFTLVKPCFFLFHPRVLFQLLFPIGGHTLRIYIQYLINKKKNKNIKSREHIIIIIIVLFMWLGSLLADLHLNNVIKLEIIIAQLWEIFSLPSQLPILGENYNLYSVKWNAVEILRDPKVFFFYFILLWIIIIIIIYWQWKSNTTHLPPHGAFFGELPEDDVLLGVLFLVLLATSLYKEGIRSHPSSWFTLRHFVSL